MNSSLPPRRWLLRGLALLAVLALLSPAGVAAVTDSSSDHADLQRGTIQSPADGETVVSVQGFHFEGRDSEKKPARLVSVGERGETEWVYNGSKRGATWFYDVDPMPNGNLLVTSTKPGTTLVYELDPETKEREWEEEFDLEDTHDVARLSEDELVVANMRQWDEGYDTSNDRVFVYNRTTGEITWEWYFKDHYPESTDGGMNEDWSHVNDVDVLDDERLLLSPRNFDQAIIVDRETGEIEERLGEDDDHDVLNEQHNPDYLESEDGAPTMLVADSENDRVVEYAKEDGEWTKTWEVGGPGQLNWPRDADRLPNGNTLITDTLNHRVIEVTPEGEIVWEYYATWGPYDAERVEHGPESNGPTIADMEAQGTYDVRGSAGLRPGTGDRLPFAVRVEATFSETPLEGPMVEFARTWSHVTPWIQPTWMTSWDFAFAVFGLLTALGWGAVEVVYQRRRLLDRARTVAARIRA
ncbi:aryl-sulfate sulfotransferase [Halegenticoccus tardaugens]|uniref:aryl-sulfate sulfotransferase n=1 Tax=Halegenticoccus tardaugens TaxID=2071624 RepID=UPI00100C2E8D|nr:aryl-sulfate sulfotransferase [Halegenticoccus tardaugens]